MSRVGRTSSKFYRETRGLKISGGQPVKSGSILTRQGHRWKPGINVVGEMSLTAKCDGEIYFTRKKNRYNKVVTYVNVRPEAK